MLGPMDFARVVSDKKMKGSGLSRGDVVFIASRKELPILHNDPYLLRIYVIVAKVVDGLPQLPREDNDHLMITVDPRNLEKVNEEELKTYARNLTEKYHGAG